MYREVKSDTYQKEEHNLSLPIMIAMLALAFLTSCCRVPVVSSDFGANSAGSAIIDIQNSSLSDKEKDALIQKVKACQDSVLTCKGQLDDLKNKSKSDLFKMWLIVIGSAVFGFVIGYLFGKMKK